MKEHSLILAHMFKCLIWMQNLSMRKVLRIYTNKQAVYFHWSILSETKRKAIIGINLIFIKLSHFYKTISYNNNWPVMKTSFTFTLEENFIHRFKNRCMPTYWKINNYTNICLIHFLWMKCWVWNDRTCKVRVDKHLKEGLKIKVRMIVAMIISYICMDM